MMSGCTFKNGASTQVLRKVRNLTKFDLCITIRKNVNEESANFVHIMYLLAKLCIIFDEAFLLMSVYIKVEYMYKGVYITRTCFPDWCKFVYYYLIQTDLTDVGCLISLLDVTSKILSLVNVNDLVDM